MAPWFVLGFGLLLAGLGVRAILKERRAAVVGRRPIRPDLIASCTLLFVIAALALLLGLAMLLVFPRD